jgi:hypothetical protein
MKYIHIWKFGLNSNFSYIYRLETLLLKEDQDLRSGEDGERNYSLQEMSLDKEKDIISIYLTYENFKT